MTATRSLSFLVCSTLLLHLSLAFVPYPSFAVQKYQTLATSSGRESNIQLSVSVSVNKNKNNNAVQVQATSSTLGKLHRIRLPGQEDDNGDNDDSFVAAMAVPTFCATNGTTLFRTDTDSSSSSRPRGLEGVLGQGPAFVLDNIVSPDTCEEWIETFETLGFGSFHAGKNHHGAMQVVVSPTTAESLGQALGRHVHVGQVEELAAAMNPLSSEDVRLVYAGLNRRWRVYRYAPGGTETFAPHIDAAFPPSGVTADEAELVWDDTNVNGDGTGVEASIVSRLTVLFYLNDDFVGGETKFYQPVAETKGDGTTADPPPPPCVIASVRPVAGSCLVFPQGVGEEAVEYARQHWPLHEGSPVKSGRPKYVVRSDVLFAEQRETLPLEDPFQRYDHLVRQTFLPRSPALNDKFLHHVSSLYNPHMGVENMGPFLYSFLRLTKKRQIVEIGAGYTSPWILQALKDNDDEMERIRELQRSGQCRLMDWPWTVPDAVETHDQVRASLLCVDNCEHQKETATGAAAVAKSLGLDSYFSFLRCNAFDLDLEGESVDVLWCDFGVGARMKDFASSAWTSIRPGGFLLCHSTLTNTHTRDWLEAVRSKQGQDITGIPGGEYIELSLLEPHKHYQNSISIIQKRKDYNEPLYSEYA